MGGMLDGLPKVAAYVVVAAIYFYAHYFFASATAHIGALYSASLAILIASGIKPFSAAITLACMSNVFGCLTQYAIGSAPVLFGAGYLKQQVSPLFYVNITDVPVTPLFEKINIDNMFIATDNDNKFKDFSDRTRFSSSTKLQNRNARAVDRRRLPMLNYEFPPK